ncbi:tail fiber domain-containing protein [Winogradskyella helgolandensis]|uniref:tail fiber domain-containing protein n=1 Tax=Winogradskyella helgolandensis TaxID=2697010 RepID=UPI0015CDCB14|nr:tail fiber domain-containing protein [Winogradskyella helgolandensis]
MKSLITLSLTLLLATLGFAQNGINYKAIIKDNSGNVIANDLISVQFTILQGVAQTSVYKETHTPTTDANGLIIVNIGEGTPVSGTFATIDWASDTTFLNTKINTGSGMVDMGTTEFKTVPYAINAKTATNVTGLEAIIEGNGTGWRLKGRDSNNYGDIGANAVDMSVSYTPSTTMGATGFLSTAMGRETTASGNESMATGYYSEASGTSSIAMGHNAKASGDYAIAMGFNPIASGQASTATGYNTTASQDYATALGYNTIASNYGSTAMGIFTIASGQGSTVMGDYTEASGQSSVAMGQSTIASGQISTSMGLETEASGDYALAMGRVSIASGQASTSMGLETEASGDYASAMGYKTLASGSASTAMGSSSTASGGSSTAMGSSSTASGGASTAMGSWSTASGGFSTAMGNHSEASGSSSMAMGSYSIASGYASSAMGTSTIAQSVSSTALGRFNVGGGDALSWVVTDPLFEIGNGSSNTARTNALTVLKNGTITAPSFDLAEITDPKALITKEYADTKLISIGLEAIDEGNGIGWRLKGRNPDNFGNIGEGAIDFSENGGTFPISNAGATGGYSTAMGYGTRASGYQSIAMGSYTTASGGFSTAMGSYTTASGIASTAIGSGTTASSYASLAIGRYNVGGGNATSWVTSDPLFEVGVGTFSSHSNALTILKNGKVGIGTSTPSTYLHITNGSDASYTNNSGYMVIGEVTGTNIVFDQNEIIARNNGAISTLFLQQDGGDVRVGGVVVHSSDRRLKKDITPLPYGLETILELNPVEYNWKNREQDHKSLGLIAQEVQPILENIVHIADDEDKTLSVSYTELIPVLIKAIKEQQEIIDAQSKTINTQDSKIDTLTAELNQLKTLDTRVEKLEAMLKTVDQ